MNITFAIPTYNRLRCLSNLIDSIEEIHVPEGVNLYVAISNSGSKDETSIYLDILKCSNPEKYFINNKLNIH
jgi:glycosyltransferase involved in cell wall biosynthesis